ncbi:MAG: helix-turn-helix domain-containing protein [Eubacteriaceae bacterium]
MDRRTLDGKELAEYLGVSYWKVMEMARRGQIPCIKIGDRKLFRKETIDKWMDQQEEESQKVELDAHLVRRIL